MALFNLFRESRSSTLQDNQQVYLNDAAGIRALFNFASDSFSGENVTRETALGIPAVAAAVNAMSDAVAAIPLQLYKNTAEGRQKASGDPLYRIVHDVVNRDLLTSYQWRKWLMTELMLEGRALSIIERNKAGRVMGLWPLELKNVKIEIRDGHRIYKRSRSDGKPDDEFKSSEILDFVWMPGPDAITHINPIINARNALGLAIAAERYASVMFENGGIPPIFLTGVPIKGPGSTDRMSDDIEATVRETRKSKKWFTPLPAPIDVKPIGIDPEKQQMLELRKFQLGEIARVWNIPPVLLHDLTSGTFNNAAQQASAFVKFCLAPRLAAIEAELNTKLFPASQFGFVEFNVDGLLRGDDTARANFYGTGFKNGWLTPNEIREMENRPRSSQPEADLLHVQGATVPLGMQSTAQPVTGDQPQTEEPDEPAATDQ